MIEILTETDLHKLLTNSKAGDRNAQREIYKHYYSFAIGICIRYATNRMESVEIMNNGFCTLFSSPKSVKRDEAFSESLQKIMIHSVISYYKDELACTVKKSTRFSALNNLPSERDLVKHHLLSAVQNLPVIQRLIFNLYAIDGYSNAEICKMLNVTNSSLERMLLTARKTLNNMDI